MLNFDSWQRHETVKHLLNWALSEEGAHILDVGGYPGRMRSFLPKHNWVLCDPLVDAPGDQVKGSGNALPFQDSTFDFSVSLDVLEHVPPDRRKTMLDEMVRVSKQGLVLSFPHLHPLVQAAEKHVSEVYYGLHQKAHPWLSEHSQFPLPDENTLVEHVRSYGGQAVVFDVGAIHRWVYLQLLDLLLEATPGGLDLAERLDEFYQEHLYIHEFKPPSYRKIVLHIFDAEEALDLSMIETEREEELAAEVDFHHVVVSGLLQLDKNLQRATLQETEQFEESRNDETGSSAIEFSGSFEYIHRLEKSVQLWEETYAKTVAAMTEAHRWRDQLENRFSFQVYKRMMRLLGRKIEP